MKFLKLAFTAAALACAAVPAHAQSALQDILSNGVLKVGTTGDWNPMTMKDPATNSYTGYDIDVMTELAKDLDVKLEFVATDWKTLLRHFFADVCGEFFLDLPQGAVPCVKHNVQAFRCWLVTHSCVFL